MNIFQIISWYRMTVEQKWKEKNQVSIYARTDLRVHILDTVDELKTEKHDESCIIVRFSQLVQRKQTNDKQAHTAFQKC